MKINCPKCNAEIEASDLNFWGCAVCAPENKMAVTKSIKQVKVTVRSGGKTKQKTVDVSSVNKSSILHSSRSGGR